MRHTPALVMTASSAILFETMDQSAVALVGFGSGLQWRGIARRAPRRCRLFTALAADVVLGVKVARL